MVEGVKLFLAAWTLKNIRIKLVHLLGGVSKEEAIKINNDSFYQGDAHGRKMIKFYLTELERQIYDKPEQEWISIVRYAIKNL